MMDVFVVVRNENIIAGVCSSKKSANIHIKHLIEDGFDHADSWDIIQYTVIKN